MEFVTKKKVYSVREGRKVLYESTDYNVVEKVYDDLKKSNDKIFIWEI